MAHVSILDHCIPDASGNVFFESYGVKDTNDIFPAEVLVFNDSARDDQAFAHIRIPDDYSSGAEFSIVWTSTATTGNVRWAVAYFVVSGNDVQSFDTTATQEKLEVTDAAPSAAHERLRAQTTSPAGANFVAGDNLLIILSREGADAADTMAAAAIVFDAYLEYTPG